MQDANKVLQFRDTPLTSHHQHMSTAASLGGNLHNEYVEMDTPVALYKAVEMQNQKLCHIGNYIAYYRQEDGEV